MAESTHDLASRLGSGLEDLVDRGAVPAASYAVICDGAVTTGGFGGAGPHSVFQVGSVTKAFTGLLLADLVQRGQVLLSDPATSHLPGAVRGPATLLDIATHTAGLPRLPPGLLPYMLLRPGDPYARYPERRFVRAVRRSLAAAPGGTRPYQYSNYGYGMLGYLLGQAAGEPYAALVQQRVCAPLGLAETTFDARPVQGHHRGRRVGPWHMGQLAAAGGLYSTAADLAVLLTACLDPDSTPLGPAIRTALTPRRPLPGGGEIGLAWHHVVRDGHRVIWHNGMTGGFSAMVALRPERRAAVAALASAGGQPPSPLDAVVLDALFAA